MTSKRQGRREETMNPRAKITQRQISLLYTAVAQLGLDREDLKARAGVRSCKDLTNADFDELMKHLKKCGFIYRRRARATGTPDPARQRQDKRVYLAAIENLLAGLSRPWKYAEGVARQMFGVRKLEWLTPEQLHKVQVALIYQTNRQAAQAGRAVREDRL